MRAFFVSIFVPIIVAIGTSSDSLRSLNGIDDYWKWYLPKTQTSAIPKRIWAFWDNEIIPPIVQGCLNGWYRYNPDHEITLVTLKTLAKYITQRQLPRNFAELSPQGKADWFRLAVLEEHGGIYLDSTTVLTRDISWLHVLQRKSDKDVIMFTAEFFQLPGGPDIYENWFIASVPDNEFISKWLDEFEVMLVDYDNNGEIYLEKVVKERYGMKVLDLMQSTPRKFYGYLTQHIVQQKIIVIDGISTHSILALASGSGPYYITFTMYGFDYKKAIQCLIWKRDKERTPPIIKLNGQERKLLQNHLANNPEIHPDSIYRRYILPNYPYIMSRTARFAHQVRESNRTIKEFFREMFQKFQAHFRRIFKRQQEPK